MLKIMTHADCIKHEMGLDHPESPARLEVILHALKTADVAKDIQWEIAPEATTEQLQRVHPKRYIDSIYSAAPKHGYIQIDPDTAMNPYTLSAALHAAGAVVKAVDDVFTTPTKRVFCAIRPPGHHAEPDTAMGFCFFNNIGVGAAHALATYGCKRIAIVDFDVHHGNGTHTMFLNEPRVLFWSSFQHPFYPGVNLSDHSANIYLCPLPAGTSSATYREKITHELIPLLNDFKPECIFISAGFDAHRNDPLANLQLTTDDYFFITKALCDVANQHSQGRIISTLEGGYDLAALAESVVAHVRAMT